MFRVMTFESSVDLDDVDWHLLEVLQEDARLTYAELGRRVSLSPPAVAERIKRLEGAGVIRGYHADLDLAKLGFPMEALIRMVISNGHECNLIGDRLRQVPEVLECHRVTGTDSFHLRVALRSVDHLEQVLSRILPSSGDTITAIVLSTVVRHRVITRQMAHPAPLETPRTA